MRTKEAILDFARAMWGDWLARMSGPLSVPAAGLAFWLSNDAGKIIFALTAFVCIWVTAYRVWERERKTRLETEAKLAQLKDSYAYSLSLTAINFEENRELDQKTKALLNRTGRFIFDFGNTIAMPVAYELRRLIIDGIEQKSLLTRGAVISGRSPASFYSPWIGIKVPIDITGTWRIEIEVSYGHPDKHTRLMTKIAVVTCNPTDKRTTFLYEKEGDAELAENS